MVGECITQLLVAKSKTPRCFKDFDIYAYEIRYKANSSSWLTEEIFSTYMDENNQRMISEKRKISIIMDNFWVIKLEISLTSDSYFCLQTQHHGYSHLIWV